MKRRAELIFIPSPGLTHLVSTLEFAKLLIDRDDWISITVLVMKLPPFTSSVDAYTKSFTSSSHSSIQLIDLPQVDLPSPDLLKLSFESYLIQFIENNIPHVRNIVADLVLSHSDDESDPARVTGLVLDFFCVSMIDVANDFGLPSYIFLTTSTGFMSLMLHLSTRHEYDQILTEFKPLDSDLSIPGFANPVPVSVLLSGMFNKVGYTSFVKIGQRFRDVKGILVNTFAELEPYAINIFSGGLNPPVYTVGPLVDLKGQPIPESEVAKHRDILKWLDDQPQSSVVFLCFGSGGSFSPAQVKEIATGLEQSEHRFLWCLRVSPPNNEFSVMNQSTNHDDFPAGFLEKTRGRGMICGWAPQVEVLAHKAVGGFVSHCGWNSILESLWYGVPIVTWPLYAEQQLNAFRMVKELGLAVELRLDSRMNNGDLVTADEISRAVGSVMVTDSEIRMKVKEISEIGRKSLMDGGSSFISMGQFINLNF
ncbi:hypothetical protein Ddye_023157 [Dipteronia dyeriana]|uniref:Glycosyltransferase n=1 Tax=Dipteronia dyeriana TaxID=168575 RepID=A0AAD9TSG1_9ROSI|nr:hypothetical protein Ddye_023157 [Dipteronia dyeriana]